MTKMKRRYQFAGMALFAFALLIIISARASRSQNPQQVQAQSERSELTDAVRKGGLREAARLKGNYVITVKPTWDAVFADVESLTSHSEIVILGAPTQSSCRLSSEGDTVITDYEVSVMDVLRGKNQPGTSIIVSALGGLVRFPDGTSAEVRTPGFKIEIGRTYVFFLSEKDTKTSAFHMTGGFQGVFEVLADGTISQDRQTAQVVKKYKGVGMGSFLQEIRNASQKW